ncbi:hypothetical protein AO262_16355 [Pseudomonas fluorescens ABAC62]|nr:hypothetical protein AO262_16355 [Pseudomonas fluorescens ABAC62]
MAVNLKGVSVGLVCALLMAEGVQAETCRVSVSQSRIDYGVIRRDTQAPSASFALDTRTLHLSVLCAEPSAMALRFVGAADGQGFRFGREGRFRLVLRHVQVDANPVEMGLANLPGDAAHGRLLPGQVLVAPVAGKRLTAQVDIDAELPANALQVRSQALLEGKGYFELVSPAAPPSR